MALLESAFDDVTAVLALPMKYHRLLRTTNSVERLNEEIRRRDRVIRIYPNRASCKRLLGALLMEFDETMSCGKIYVGMDEYRAWRTARSAVSVSSVSDAKPSLTEPQGIASSVADTSLLNGSGKEATRLAVAA